MYCAAGQYYYLNSTSDVVSQLETDGLVVRRRGLFRASRHRWPALEAKELVDPGADDVEVEDRHAAAEAAAAVEVAADEAWKAVAAEEEAFNLSLGLDPDDGSTLSEEEEVVVETGVARGKGRAAAKGRPAEAPPSVEQLWEWHRRLTAAGSPEAAALGAAAAAMEAAAAGGTAADGTKVPLNDYYAAAAADLAEYQQEEEQQQVNNNGAGHTMRARTPDGQQQQNQQQQQHRSPPGSRPASAPPGRPPLPQQPPPPPPKAPQQQQQQEDPKSAGAPAGWSPEFGGGAPAITRRDVVGKVRFGRKVKEWLAELLLGHKPLTPESMPGPLVRALLLGTAKVGNMHYPACR